MMNTTTPPQFSINIYRGGHCVAEIKADSPKNLPAELKVTTVRDLISMAVITEWQIPMGCHTDTGLVLIISTPSQDQNQYEWVLGHELGHQANGDRDFNNVAHEVRADKYGMEFAGHSGRDACISWLTVLIGRCREFLDGHPELPEQAVKELTQVINIAIQRFQILTS